MLGPLKRQVVRKYIRTFDRQDHLPIFMDSFYFEVVVEMLVKNQVSANELGRLAGEDPLAALSVARGKCKNFRNVPFALLNGAKSDDETFRFQRFDFKDACFISGFYFETVNMGLSCL
jgi:hypothetical protein